MSWIGFDIDGTIAHDDGGPWGPPGRPVASMVALVKQYRAQGHEVRLFTARVSCPEDLLPEVVAAIEAWSLEHLGEVLPITCQKDYSMWLLYDDRVVQVEKNTGRLLEHVLQRAQEAVKDEPEDVLEALEQFRLVKLALGAPVDPRRKPFPRDRPDGSTAPVSQVAPTVASPAYELASLRQQILARFGSVNMAAPAELLRQALEDAE